LLFICWELVGLASYLLIGFWFDRPAAAAAAKKAFIVTRIGDLGFLLGILWLYHFAGSLMFYTFTLILFVLLSWVAPGTYSPASALVSSLSEPLLAPVRRVIPALGGIDFSALFVIIALQALRIAIVEYMLIPGY